MPMSEPRLPMDRNLALEAVRVTEAAALAASRFIGRGDEQAADTAAMEAMRGALSALSIDGRVVVGEGDVGQVPMLFTGDKVGNGKGPAIDLALDALEGTSIVAKGGHNAVAVLALTENGGFLSVPDIHMEKIAVGPGLPVGVIDIDDKPSENLRRLAHAKNVEVEDLMVCILDRPRHEELIDEVRSAGARIVLITDGDVSGAIATALPGSGIDIYIGSGGAPEGVLAATALACAGGQMQGRLIFRHDSERAKARAAGHCDQTGKLTIADMVRGDAMFAATGVTDGAMLMGVRRHRGGAITHSLVMRARTGTMRLMESHHNFLLKEPGELK
jgi:fructose-1,6-bisphosphatase II / sedoheptulose-1,7-bisphosphatase